MRTLARRSHALARTLLVLACAATLGASSVGAASASAEGVSPMLDCVAPDPSTGHLWAYFGYASTTQASIPFGDANQVVPGIQFQGQPTVFDVGVYPRVFRATFNQFAFTSIVWELNGLAAIASAESPQCSAGQTGPVSEVTPTSATLHGTVVPDGTATALHFDYGTDTAYGSATPAASASGVSSQPTSAQIVGLTPGTTYHYRLDVTTASLATSGIDGTFTTPAAPLALSLQESLVQSTPRGRGKLKAVFTVTNDGSYGATGVRVVEVVPADAVADLATSDPSCAIDAQLRVGCAVGSLAGGASATVTVGLRATAPGRLTSVGIAAAEEPSSAVASALATVEHPFQASRG